MSYNEYLVEAVGCDATSCETEEKAIEMARLFAAKVAVLCHGTGYATIYKKHRTFRSEAKDVTEEMRVSP